MKISVYLKKCSATTSNICFRVREKNVDIKVVSPIAVHDKYWDADRRTWTSKWFPPSRSMTSIGMPIPYVTGERLP